MAQQYRIYLQCRRCRKMWGRSLGWEDPLGRAWPPTPVFLPDKFRGQRSLVSYSPRGHKESDRLRGLSTAKCSNIKSCFHHINVRFISPILFYLFFISPILNNHLNISSVQFSLSVVSDSLRPHGSQHARPPCPSPTPRVYPNSCPSSW